MRVSRPTSTAALGDRSLFPRLAFDAYLNHAGIGPASVVVEAAVGLVLETYATRGLHALPQWIDDREELRKKLATLVGGRPQDIGFVTNTSHGVGTIAQCYPWRSGDRIVVFSGEFPANVTPWQRAAQVHGLGISFVPLDDFALPGGPDLARLEAELRHGDVRIVAVSAVQFQTGLRMPLRAMADRCHAHGAELFVDGIQAVGVIPLDLPALGVDYLAAGSHKWLMGMEGGGFIYAAPGRAERLRPVTASWLSHVQPGGLAFLFDGAGHLRYDRGFKGDMSFTESGVSNSMGLAALHSSVDLLVALGPEAIFDHVSRFLDGLEAPLVERGFTSARLSDPARRSAILSVLPPPGHDLAAMAKALVARGISVSTPDGYLRFAPHWPNNGATELPLILDAVDAHLKEASA